MKISKLLRTPERKADPIIRNKSYISDKPASMDVHKRVMDILSDYTVEDYMQFTYDRLYEETKLQLGILNEMDSKLLARGDTHE